MPSEKYCEAQIIGKTSYGGEIYVLASKETHIIPALRCVVSYGTLNDEPIEILDAMEYFNKHPEEARKHVERVYGLSHFSMGELGNYGF